MIIKIHRSGRSFKGISRYLLHDVKAATSERVAWTHTLNLAETEHIATAVGEMLWTYRAADALKRAAGVPTGGDKVEKPVKHFTLAWHESTHPTRDHMIDTVKRYLDHMGWHDRQAVLIAHSDRRHPHVHVILNCISPENGRTINAYKEYIRTEAFGLQYELEQGRILCEQRLTNRDEREGTPTRSMWERVKPDETAFQREELKRAADRLDHFDRGEAATAKDKEWTLLYQYQRQEREQGFAEGKQRFKAARNAVFREVRTEFRGEWKAWFEAKRSGLSASKLARMKADILAKQNKSFDERKQDVFAKLEKSRTAEHKALLARHVTEKQELRERQAQGLRTYSLLDEAYPVERVAGGKEAATSGKDSEGLSGQFRRAGDEVCAQPEADEQRHGRQKAWEPESQSPGEPQGVKGSADLASGLGFGALGAFAKLGESLFDGFFGGPVPQRKMDGTNQTRPRGPAPEQQAHPKQPANDIQREEEVAKLQAYWEERRSRRRERD